MFLVDWIEQRQQPQLLQILALRKDILKHSKKVKDFINLKPYQSILLHTNVVRKFTYEHHFEHTESAIHKHSTAFHQLDIFGVL